VILVAGSANLDFVVQAPHIPTAGETVMGSSYSNFPGGKGANQAVACARAGGVATQFLGAFGQDSLALPIKSSLQAAGVDTIAIESSTQPTGTAFICVAGNGENAITVVPGANADLAAHHLPPLCGVSHLLLQLETPLSTLCAFARVARQHGVQVVLNAAPASRECLPLLSDVDWLVVNEGELALLSGNSGSICQQMESLCVPRVVATLGSQGCVAKVQGLYHFQPAFSVGVVDTTAAGDTFCGALVAALSEGASMPSALRSASAAAALACTRHGAQTSIPTRAEVNTLLAQSPTQLPADVDALRAYCGMND
jgi:ribokinase